jgi:hypothetical protein
MRVPERFRLQFGPYEPPKVPRNNRLLCEMRGYLKVSPIWSDGLIPWPRRYQTGSIILCGDLVRAVKMESVEAICFHWGVCRNVVQNWRRALGVPEFNPGTVRLRDQIYAGPNSPAQLRAMARAQHPKAIIRREKAQHETAHPLVRPSTSALVLERMERTGRHINPALRLWTVKEDDLLGTARDEQIARRIDRSEDAVRARRNILGIPAWHASYSKPWTPEEDALLGVVPDRALAKRLKRTFLAVQARREIRYRRLIRNGTVQFHGGRNQVREKGKPTPIPPFRVKSLTLSARPPSDRSRPSDAQRQARSQGTRMIPCRSRCTQRNRWCRTNCIYTE